VRYLGWPLPVANLCLHAASRWSVEEPDPKLDRPRFIVRDSNGQAPAYFDFQDEPGRRAGLWRRPDLAPAKTATLTPGK
jgi:hypothetical protein